MLKPESHYIFTDVDCKTVSFFLKISKQIGSLTHPMGVCGDERKISVSSQSCSLHFQPYSRPFVCSWVLEYTQIWTVLQSITNIDLQINLLICKRLSTGEEEKEQTQRKLKKCDVKNPQL